MFLDISIPSDYIFSSDMAFDCGALLLVLALSDRLAMLQCFHVLLLPWSWSFCLLQVGMIMFLANLVGLRAVFLVWCFPAVIWSSSALAAAAPCCCSFLLSSLLVLSLCPASCAVLVGDLLSLFLFSIPSFYFPFFSLRFLRSLASSFLVFPNSFHSSVIRLYSSSFSSAPRLLFLVGVFLGRCAKFFCSCS